MQEKQQIDKIRQTLIGKIRAAVKKQNGCIGTFYKNLGEHHTAGRTEEEYDDSPIVVSRNDNNRTYGNFEAATVFDLFLDEDTLVCTLNGEAGEDWDELIENIQTDGLVQIVEWLVGKSYVEKDYPWRCTECGSLDVEYTDTGSGDRNDFWCNNCMEHSWQVQENELMQTTEEWWGAADFKAMERITGYRQIDFSPEEGYQAFVDACHEWWNGKTTDEKISFYFENK